MGKYKMMLVLPFIILVMMSWMNIDAGSKRMEEAVKRQDELLEKAQKLEDDKIYYRAAELIEQARKIKTDRPNDEEMEQKLLFLYKADNNYDSWEKLLNKKIKNGKASESECTELAEYYIREKKYKNALDSIKTSRKAFPENLELSKLDNEVRGKYSYKKCDLTAVGAVNGGKIAVRGEDGMWGYTGPDGGKCNEFIYSDAVSFCGKMGLVMYENRPALINSKNKIYSVCHDPSVDGILSYDSFSAVLCSGGKYKLADDELDTSDEIYDFLGTVSDERRAYCMNGKWGFLDKKGESKIPEKYTDVAMNENYNAFGQGAAFVSDGSGYIMIDKKGNRIGDGVYDDAYPFSMDEGAPAAVKKDGKWGFVNNSGEIVLDFAFDCAKSFSSGLAAIERDGKWGYIGMDGSEIITCEYEEARPFTEAVAAVKIDGAWQFIKLDYYNY